MMRETKELRLRGGICSSLGSIMTEIFIALTETENNKICQLIQPIKFNEIISHLELSKNNFSNLKLRKFLSLVILKLIKRIELLERKEDLYAYLTDWEQDFTRKDLETLFLNGYQKHPIVQDEVELIILLLN